jgi:NADP-dependent 3-hydroxy acid dehydrogenase YdfG
VRFHGDVARAKSVYDRIAPLTGDDVADAVLYCVTRPPHVVIQQIVMTPVHQASAQVVHRGRPTTDY